MPELTLPQAAAALGVSVDTVRRRIKRGDLPARTDAAGRHLVTVEVTPTAPPAPTTMIVMEPPVVDGVDPALLHQQIEALRDQVAEAERLRVELDHSRVLLDEVRRSRDELATQVEAQRGQLQAAHETIQQDAVERAELRRLLSAAMQRAPALPAPAQQDGHDGMDVVHNAQVSPPSVPRSAPWWRRLLQALASA